MKINLPRNEELPLFHPHRVEFVCQIEATKVPPIDAQSDGWFLEARALEDDPEMLDHERDYKKIVQLTRQAAERRHWKAILNLASLYLEGRDPLHGNEDAILLVEQAMQLGIPAAYDRIGTYVMNGVAPGDASRAYALWQKAADMGNPQAMTFLGEKLAATWDNPKEFFWANLPVAIKMLECAFSQGDGEAAYQLHFEYAPLGVATAEQKQRALRILQEGVRLGSQSCAASLAVDFDGPRDTSKMMAPFIDKARSARYLVLSGALRFSPSRRFPNLDKVLPLPPAPLPRWDGKRDTLLKAAMMVTPPASPRIPPAVRGNGREALDAAFDLRPTGETTSALHSPFASYWRPSAPHETAAVRSYLAGIAPGLYATGEAFIRPLYPDHTGRGAIPGIVWERMLTVPHNSEAVAPKAAAGLSRELARPEPLLSCGANDRCPLTGTWQPWLPTEHPLRHSVNQPWRQGWVTEGQAFPNPRRDWRLSLDDNELSWHLLDSTHPMMV